MKIVKELKSQDIINVYQTSYDQKGDEFQFYASLYRDNEAYKATYNAVDSLDKDNEKIFKKWWRRNDGSQHLQTIKKAV